MSAIGSPRGAGRVPLSIDDVVPIGDTLRAAVEVAAAKANAPLVLAVSGGRDSMALLHAMAAWAPSAIATVATFDHGTGSHATDAASLVVAEARRLGFTVVRERARGLASSEEAWREARWSYLRRVAKAFRARIATAHTRDDQLETVVLRLLRGTGARGLAALAATSPVVRPWLPLARAEIASWAESRSVPFVHDPTNESRRYQRSRVRYDLLPALERARDGFAEEMLAVAARAAEWRCEVERFTEAWILPQNDESRVHVPVEQLRQTTAAGRAVAWPALMARVGITLDRRGTSELERFAAGNRIGAMLQLAGGGCVVRVRANGIDAFEIRRSVGPVARLTPQAATPAMGQSVHRAAGWRLIPERRASDAGPADQGESESSWRCELPRAAGIALRSWNAGDRIRTKGAPAGRRVARYLSEARIPAIDRSSWPVVVWEGEIVWIPGVCRSVAAPNRPGWSDLIWYRCEREHS